jgi:hypothetical protein
MDRLFAPGGCPVYMTWQLFLQGCLNVGSAIRTQQVQVQLLRCRTIDCGAVAVSQLLTQRLELARSHQPREVQVYHNLLFC